MARSRRRTGNTTEKWLPLGYFAAALALVIAVLPTVLRPPQQPPTQSAELSPDAPPDPNQQSIVASLQRAQSEGAGATVEPGAGPGGEGGVAPAPPVVPVPSKGRCVGNPPRQVESLYSAPCQPAWTERNNGGSTYKNVFPGEVRIAQYHSLDGCDAKPVPLTKPEGNESAGNRTFRVLQQYLNQHFETYGRQIRIYCLDGGASDADMAENATAAADEFKVFLSNYIAIGYCRDMVRRQLPVFCDPPSKAELLAARPYMYAFQMDRTTMQEMGAEYYCKKLLGKPARFAGPTSGYRNTVRRLGVITEATTETGNTDEPFNPAVKRMCNAEIVDTAVFTTSTAPEQVAAALARFKTEGITTVMFNVKFVNQVTTLGAADGADYHPEWLIASPYGMDVNGIGGLFPQAQMSQVFGLSGYEWPRPESEGECFRAYRSVDPTTSPDGNACATSWIALIQMASAIQTAGPDLTPDTVWAGLKQTGYRFYEDIPHAIGGGYGPEDPSYIDNAGEIWWDPTARRPENDNPGAYRWVRCGKRWRPGQQPVEDPLVFQDGGTGPGRDGCPRPR